jgi:hypothetical protein
MNLRNVILKKFNFLSKPIDAEYKYATAAATTTTNSYRVSWNKPNLAKSTHPQGNVEHQQWAKYTTTNYDCTTAFKPSYHSITSQCCFSTSIDQ